MKSLPAILLLSGALGLGSVPPLAAQTTTTTTTTPPSAPTTPPAAPATPQATPTAEDTRLAARSADRAALFEARLAAMHAGLTLTPEQDKLWPAVDQAIRGFAKMRAARHDRRVDAEQDREDRTDAGRDEDPIAELKAYSDALLERAQAFKALSDAVDPLYAALSEDQKNRIPLLLRDIAPGKGPIAKLAERFEDDTPPAGDRDADLRPRRPEPFAPGDRADADRRWREGRDGFGGGRSLYRDGMEEGRRPIDHDRGARRGDRGDWGRDDGDLD